MTRSPQAAGRRGTAAPSSAPADGGAFVARTRTDFARPRALPGGASGEPAWLESLRQSAFGRFSTLGLPAPSQEAWRFTNVQPIGKIPFERPEEPGSGEVTEALLDAAVFGVRADVRLVFVNGRFREDLSSTARLPRSVKLTSLAHVLKSDPGALQPHVARTAPYADMPFTALNTAFFDDGALLEVADQAAVESPIYLVYVSVPGTAPMVTYPRTLVVAGRDSRLTLVECYAGPARGTYFTNAVTEILAAPGAVVDHSKLQSEGEDAVHIANFQARLDRGAALTSSSLSLGGKLVRNDVGALLAGEGATCTLDGLFLATGHRHIDNHTLIDHATAHGTSRETYKGILDGSGRGVFDGAILVRPDAQKTDARQANRNLLLSDNALMNTKPQLEIRADDVKCAHAATIGRLDEASLFYLRSRGLDLETARALLIHAFAGEILGRIKPAPLRGAVDAAIARMLIGRLWGDGLDRSMEEEVA